MGNTFSNTFVSDMLLNYSSMHSPKPSYTIKVSQTKWAAIYRGLPSSREFKENEMIILDNMDFYNINILSTRDPIDEMTYLEIYSDFKSHPIYKWGRIPDSVSKMVQAGVLGLCDQMTDNEQGTNKEEEFVF